ncbi:MAG: 30S ribosomal protein S30e [Candidatus Heimdallarchaeota archaeon]|nr:30S ribosomal protein S30e [Candidatus Heimdallarchaeota archaeon]
MTHGRLQNAGIVRKRTPKVPKKYPDKKSLIPRIRNKVNFHNRYFRNKPAGQDRGRRR